ncbi:MAG: response regulator [Holophagales bacterium]|jgi:DNA-binding response OmpR family regulator/signal transduction histidine kinase|nr:response regulator [Holophagales bacterium]
MGSDSTIKILCIEDNATNYRLVQRLLSQAGFEMFWAEEGISGFDMALQIAPDLILMDINLPGLSGFELTSKFRSRQEFADTPIIALTAKTQKSDRETALVAGCTGFIPKPIDPFTFVGQIKNYLGGRQERLDKGAEGRALRQYNVRLVEQLEQQLHEAQDANKKLTESQRVLEATNKSLTRLVSLSQTIMQERDAWQLLKKVANSLLLEVPCDNFAIYMQHPSRSYWEGFHLSGGGLEAAPILPEGHPFIQKLLNMDTHDEWTHGPALHSLPIWSEGYQMDIWKHSGQPCLLLHLDRESPAENESENIAAPRGFWTFDRAADKPFLQLDLEMMLLYGRLAKVCVENSEMILEMEEKNLAIGTSYEHLEQAYRDLQSARSELREKERQDMVKDLFVKTANHLREPVETLGKSCAFLFREIKEDSGPAWDALLSLSQAASQIEAVLQGLLRRTQSETVNLPEWIDLESLFRDEVAFMEIEGLLQQGQMQSDMALQGARIYGINSDFARLLRIMVLNSICDNEAGREAGPIQFRAWREGGTVFLKIQDSAGPMRPSDVESAFEPFQRQREAVPGVRAPHPGLPLCRQTLATYGGTMEMESLGQGASIVATITLGG